MLASGGRGARYGEAAAHCGAQQRDGWALVARVQDLGEGLGAAQLVHDAL